MNRLPETKRNTCKNMTDLQKGCRGLNGTRYAAVFVVQFQVNVLDAYMLVDKESLFKNLVRKKLRTPHNCARISGRTKSLPKGC